MKLAVVIPNWNGADMIAECLRSLEKQTQNCDIIVVDNGSIDESVYIIEEMFPDVILLKLHKNTGFAGGVNTGIKYALENNYDAIALFNNDAIADKNWLKELAVQLKNDPKTGIVTGKLLREDRVHFDSTGDYYSTWGIPFPRARNKKDTRQHDTVEPVFGASGGASLYRCEMLQEIGLFDERFFAYFEDVDISFRARLSGWNIIYTSTAVAYHALSATSSKLGDFTRYHSIKNFLMLYTKNMPFSLYWKYFPYFSYQFTRTTVRSLLDGKPHVWLKSIATFLWYLPGILKDRWELQSNRKISVTQAESLLYKGRPPKIPALD